MVNQLYLHTHGGWGLEQTPEETPQSHGPGEEEDMGPGGMRGAVLWHPTPAPHPARRNPARHRVSWVEAPPSPEVHHPQPTLASLVEDKEEQEDNYRDEEEDAEDELTAHVSALVRARSSYVARQYRGLQARLTSDSGGPHRPGDPATELLQDVRHLLTDLQEYLTKDPDVRAVFGSTGPGAPQKDKDLGNGEDWKEPPRA